MRMHHVRSKITMINNNEGELVSDPEGIKEVIVDFYKELFTIHKSAMAMKKGKIPGPDGYPVELYKDTWDIIKISIYEGLSKPVFSLLMNGYHKNSGKARCAIKIDITKVYDTVRWKFLWEVIDKIDSPPIFVK
ncbi:hypothetical protein LIER_31542 [Lithospermum erythrorhizon]|uniref:Reverse transcriptase domain-containing protein n=1 Tax=Lithospermum erythrorhizon TaxID=34254 RepID=A0AAV3RS05_LITER